jgi:chemotaxis protein MotA
MFTSDLNEPYYQDLKPFEEKQYDRTVLVGIALCVVLLSVGVVLAGKIQLFFDLPSFCIVAGGTFGATLIHFPLYDLIHAWNAFKEIIFVKSYHAPERINYLVELSTQVRKDGILILESAAKSTDDRFLARAFELTVDGQSQADIKRVLETEMRSSHDRSARAIQVFQTMASYAPALGLIGTLVGLIQMLSSLENPSSVGPAMSVALVTTLYGALLANVVFLPTAGKLKNRADEESLVKAITLEGILAIGNQENPIVVEQRLVSFLPISTRNLNA